MRFAAFVAASSVLFLVGCTQPTTSSVGDFRGAEKDVAQQVADLAEDANKRKPTDICGGIVSARLREQIAGGSSCTDEVKKAIEDADGFDLKVDDVTITGNTATAAVSNTDGDRKVTRTFRFVREDGGWRISSFG